MVINNDIEKPIGVRGRFTYLILQIGWPFLVLLIILLSIVYIDIKYTVNKIDDNSLIPRESLSFLATSISRESTSVINNGNLITSLYLSVGDEELKEYAQRLLLTKPQFPRIIFYDNNIKKVWQVDSIVGDSLTELEPIKVIPDYAYAEKYYDKINNSILYRTYFPVNDKSGKAVGFLEVVFDFTYFWTAISQFEANDVFVFNNKGQVLLSKVVYENLNDIETKIYNRYSSKLNTNIIFKDEGGDDTLGYAQKIPSSDYIIVVEKSLKEISKESRNIIVNAVILLLAIFILVILEIYIFRKKIYNPLKSLEGMSFKISKGDYDSWSVSWAGNEFDIVSIAINQVVFSIKTLREDFEVQITEKTKSLEDKIKDSEVMGSFMINRELRMIDIKNELNRVKESLDKCEKEKSVNVEEGEKVLENINLESKETKEDITVINRLNNIENDDINRLSS